MTTFGELRCEVCEISGKYTPMYRANPKGEKGRWRCINCMTTPVDIGVRFISEIIQNDFQEELCPTMGSWGVHSFHNGSCITCGYLDSSY